MTIKGFLYLLIATLTYGVLHVIDKAALVAGIDSTAYTISRVFIAALILVCTAFPRTKNPLNQIFGRHSLKNLVVIGVLASGWGLLLQITGLNSTSATNAGLLLTLVAPITTIFATIILKESVSRKLILATCLMLTGVVTLYGLDQTTHFGIGDMLILISAVGYGYSNVLVKKTMRDTPATIVTIGRLVFGSISIALVIPFLATPMNTILVAPQYVALGGAVFGLRMVAYHKGIQLEGASVAATFLLFCPLVTTISAKVFLHESWSSGTILGIFLTLIGGWILVRPEKKIAMAA